MGGSSGGIGVANRSDTVDRHRGDLERSDLAPRRHRLDGEGLERSLGRHTEADDPEEVLKARPASSLLGSSVEEGREGSALADDQARASHGSSQHLAGDRHRVSVEVAEGERDVTDGAGGIEVDQGSS